MENCLNLNARMMINHLIVEPNQIMNKPNYILPQFLAAMLTITLLAGGSPAAPILDQSQEQFNGFAAIDAQGSLAQTFTPSVSGQLDHVDLNLCNVYGDPWAGLLTPTTIAIFPTDGAGAPTGTALSTVLVTEFTLDTDYDVNGDGTIDTRGGWNSVDFLPLPVMLTAGNLYAIVISNNDPDYTAPPSDTFLIQVGEVQAENLYSQGVLWIWQPSAWAPLAFGSSPPGLSDAAFRTYMVPEPASLLIFLGPALALLFLKRKRTNQACILVPAAQPKPIRMLNSNKEKMKLTKSLSLRGEGCRRESYDEERTTIMAQWRATRRSSVCLGLILFISLVWGLSTAQASVISFDLSIEFSGAWTPVGTPPWLNATFEDSVVPDEVTLTLSTPNLTDAESIKEWAFNLDPLLDPTSLAFSAPVKTGSFNAPAITTGNNFWKADGDGYFDIKITFDTSDSAPSRFGAGDAVVYTISGISGLTAESFDFISEPSGGAGEYKTAAHVLSIGPTDNDSGWVATPEPVTLVLLTIGAGIVVFFKKLVRR